MTAHPDHAQIELFVLGALDDAESALFTDHVAACGACSAKLAEEAKLELALMDLPKSRSAAVVAPRPQRIRQRVAFATAGFAAAAAIALWAFRGAIVAKRDLAAAGAPRAVASCPDGVHQLDCIAEAHRDGRTLEYPRAGAIAALGSTPGLSVLIEPGLPTPPMPEFAGIVDALRPELTACIERNLMVQSKPILTGEYTAQTEIGPDGKVTSANTLLIVENGHRPEGNVFATTSCFEGSWLARRFPATGHTSRAETSIKFVWRE
jgi:hypothetical protein